MQKKGLSLRYKLLAALTVIPVLGLSFFLLLAKTIFENDKIAYVFDASLSVSKTRAARVGSEIQNVVSMAQAIVLSYQADTKSLTETGTYYFEREAKFEAFQIYAFDAASGKHGRMVDLHKGNFAKLMEAQAQSVSEMVEKARDKGMAVRGAEGGPGHMLFAARFGEANDPKHVVAVVLTEASELADVFAQRGPFHGFLARKATGTPVFAGDKNGDWGPEQIWTDLGKGNNLAEGIAELKSPEQIWYLASWADVGLSELVVVSMVDKQAALVAVQTLIRQCLSYFMVVISLTTIIAVILSRSMTSALSLLSFASRKISEGEFGVRVEVKTGGEIGQLATSFNAMAGEVSRLMAETADKARMESELATAKAVQETLFPESFAQIGPVQIAGHYVPASECGGDWWYYCENGGRVYIWIGDATGHGAPAALLTSAARAVASVITFGPPRSVSESLGILNRAICETSKGKMMMTFFLACIDKSTGEMTYANASHEPPMILHKTSSEPKRDDFIPLNEVNNPRLGEQADREFKSSSVMLQPGDSIVFYTDGVVDVKSPDKKNWGERRFMKSLAGHLTGTPKLDESIGGIVTTLEEFRADTPLDDDVTLILCHFAGPESSSAGGTGGGKKPTEKPARRVKEESNVVAIRTPAAASQAPDITQVVSEEELERMLEAPAEAVELPVAEVVELPLAQVEEEPVKQGFVPTVVGHEPLEIEMTSDDSDVLEIEAVHTHTTIEKTVIDVDDSLSGDQPVIELRVEDPPAVVEAEEEESEVPEISIHDIPIPDFSNTDPNIKKPTDDGKKTGGGGKAGAA